ncbi:hypothetical protein [Sphingobium indicum]|uniref:hypothetical protein n=1 Tax=Sphingobium indicum TaxID=332055 RepID=UPI000565971B|nr:hypothetical protein [Sphingobium indicum]
MREPSLRTSRLAIAGGLTAAMALGALGFFIGRETAPGEPPARPIEQIPAPTPTPSMPEQPSVLERADIIALADRAADAFSSGRPAPAEITGLAGRRFELVLPFGCEGPTANKTDEALGWRYSADDQVLRVHIAATRWQLDQWGVTDPQTAARITEGFWVTRPWMSSTACPAHAVSPLASGTEPVSPIEQTLAIAEMKPDLALNKKPRSSRTFDTVKRVRPDDLDLSKGFRIRLTGRIAELPGGQSIRCAQPVGTMRRPACIVAVSFEEMALENMSAARPLATWSMSAPSDIN